MTKKPEVSIEALVPQINESRQNPFDPDRTTHPAEPVVLEEAVDEEVYQHCPVSLLCPGCGNIITRYRYGLPTRVSHFDEECQSCDVELLRWSVTVVNTAYETTPGPEYLASITTSYWERNLWDGIVTGERCARTAEYTQAYSEQAREFEWNWTVTCPLCRKSLNELEITRLDYHHWQEDPDQGICLCRNCHKAVSGGTNDMKQDWLAQELGLVDKHDLQITRLALREQIVSEHTTLLALVEQIQERYNIVQSKAEIYDLLEQTLQSSVILESVNDRHLVNGLCDETVVSRKS